MRFIGIDMSKASFHAALDEKNVKVFKNSEEDMRTSLQEKQIILSLQQSWRPDKMQRQVRRDHCLRGTGGSKI
jgi:hypothetical protein